MNEPWYSPDQLANRLGHSKQTLAHWRCFGTGPEYVKVGRRIFYPHSCVEAFIRDSKPKIRTGTTRSCDSVGERTSDDVS